MRNITRCDICNVEKSTDKPRVPNGFMLVNGLDFCGDCYKEFVKGERKLIKDLQKERYRKDKQKGSDGGNNG